jgi:hypothetical protein
MRAHPVAAAIVRRQENLFEATTQTPLDRGARY